LRHDKNLMETLGEAQMEAVGNAQVPRELEESNRSMNPRVGHDIWSQPVPSVDR
jgi:hypothetical protein